jgi:hypothetical protein
MAKVTNRGATTMSFREKSHGGKPGKLVEVRAGEAGDAPSLEGDAKGRFELAKSMGVLVEGNEAAQAADANPGPQSLSEMQTAKGKK